MALLQFLLAVIYFSCAICFSMFPSGPSYSGVQSYGPLNTPNQELVNERGYVYGCRVARINQQCPYDQRVEVTREYVSFLCNNATFHLRESDFHCLSAGPVILQSDTGNNVRCRSLSSMPYLPLNDYDYQNLCVKKHWWQKVFGKK